MPIPTPPPAIERPRRTFTIPKVARVFAGDPSTVTFAPVTAGLEISANRAAVTRGGGTDASLTLELCRRSVVAVDGKEVDWSDSGKADAVSSDWIDATSPQVRLLLSRAFMQVNRPDAATEADFLASGETKVG
jgi:hypothetical protein